MNRNTAACNQQFAESLVCLMFIRNGFMSEPVPLTPRRFRFYKKGREILVDIGSSRRPALEKSEMVFRAHVLENGAKIEMSKDAMVLLTTRDPKVEFAAFTKSER